MVFCNMKSRGNKRRSGHNLPGCEGCVDIVKEEARFRKVQQKNEDSQTSEGMRGSSGLVAAVLTVMAVVSFSLISLFCLWCKRKSKIIQGDHQIYPPQTFHHGGSVFAVTRSKTVIRANQIAPGETCFNVSAGQLISSEDTVEDQADYENVINAQTGSAEHTYVHPLSAVTYIDEEEHKNTSETGQTPGVYENIMSSSPQEDDDYVNTQFLNDVETQDDEEPDYVNENGVW